VSILHFKSGVKLGKSCLPATFMEIINVKATIDAVAKCRINFYEPGFISLSGIVASHTCTIFYYSAKDRYRNNIVII